MPIVQIKGGGYVRTAVFEVDALEFASVFSDEDAEACIADYASNGIEATLLPEVPGQTYGGDVSVLPTTEAVTVNRTLNALVAFIATLPESDRKRAVEALEAIAPA